MRRQRNRIKRTPACHKENLQPLEKGLREQEIPLDLDRITDCIVRNNLVLYAIEKSDNKPQTVNICGGERDGGSAAG